MMPTLQASIPAAIKINVISDRTQTIRASIADVQFTLLLTVALVVMVIFVFLRSFRPSPCRCPWSAPSPSSTKWAIASTTYR
jgi:multidrug efflux pump subunit AcrB